MTEFASFYSDGSRVGFGAQVQKAVRVSFDCNADTGRLANGQVKFTEWGS